LLVSNFLPTHEEQ